MPFEFEKLEIEGLVLIKPKAFGDERGFFMESYKKSEFVKNGIDCDFVQDNHSKSVKGVLRGLHYQVAPKAQAKLVRCVKGQIYDFAVDLRPNSKTYGKWARVELSEENKNMLFIPRSFAHGFVVISDNAEIMYKTDNEYSPEHDRGVLWCDKDININWCVDSPILSDKDKIQPKLSEINKEELLQEVLL